MGDSRIKVTVLIGVLLLTLVLLVPACGDDDETEPTVPRELVIGMSTFGSEQWLGPIAGATDNTLMEGVLESLFYNKSGEVVPRLAESVDMNDDGTVYTFRLRQGVQFHDDWGEMTAEDVKYSINLGASEESKSISAGWLRDNIASIDVVNDYELRVTFNGPVAMPTATGRLGDNAPPVCPIISKAYVEAVGKDEANRKPIGTGPYKFVSHQLGESIRLEKNPNYWGEQPYYDKILMKLQPDVVTRVAALKAGEVDIADITPEHIGEIEATDGITIMATPVVYDESINFGKQTDEDVGLRPWIGTDEDALKVRKALCLAINRTEIIEYVFKNYAEPMSVWCFWPDSKYTDPSWEPYPYQPELAKQLLDEAGYPEGFDVTILTMTREGRSTSPDVATAVEGYWEDNLGLNVKVENVDYAGTFRPKFFGENGIADCYTWAFSRRDALELYGFGVLGFPVLASYGELKGLAAAANTALHTEERIEAARNLGEYVYNNYLGCPIAGGKTLYGVNEAKVGYWELAASPYMVTLYTINP